MRCLSPILVRPKGRDVVRAPCGQCIACRLNKQRDLAVRGYHELKKHLTSVFCTLTFNNECCPEEISVKDLQLFFKRLRKAISPRTFRYIACGEYGDSFGRPHYHFIGFNLFLTDTDFIQSAWPFGFVKVVPANKQTIKYVCKYVLKKVISPIPTDKKQPFVLMSKRPAIGLSFIEEFGEQVSELGHVDFGGFRVPVPRYYKQKIASLFGLDVKKPTVSTSLKPWVEEDIEVHNQVIRNIKKCG